MANPGCRAACPFIQKIFSEEPLGARPLLSVDDTAVKRRNISIFTESLSRGADAFVSPTPEHSSQNSSVKSWLHSRMSNH